MGVACKALDSGKNRKAASIFTVTLNTRDEHSVKKWEITREGIRIRANTGNSNDTGTGRQIRGEPVTKKQTVSQRVRPYGYLHTAGGRTHQGSQRRQDSEGVPRVQDGEKKQKKNKKTKSKKKKTRKKKKKKPCEYKKKNRPMGRETNCRGHEKTMRGPRSGK